MRVAKVSFDNAFSLTVSFGNAIMGTWVTEGNTKPDPDTLYPCQRYFIA
nr:MAG TPA: hypothetical protein [Siphoviridae sp. ctqcj14]